MSIHSLHDVLAAAIAKLPLSAIAVGYSGGLDSTVLLHALASLPQARERGLRAIHIDHGLHTDSSRWSAQCALFVNQLKLAFHTVAINIMRDGGLGLEAAARQARYAAFETELQSGEILSLAHHRDDQAETVLLKLMRGAGPEGLAAMRVLRPFAQGFIWRPFLNESRAALEDYARQNRLTWINDPSNSELTLNRNFLRLEILPRLRQHWPKANDAIAQSATWSRAAAEFIETETKRALPHLQGLDPNTLRWQEWLSLPDALRDPVLRHWLRSLNLPQPTYAQAVELARQLNEAQQDRLPCVSWPGAALRRYRDLLYAMAAIDFPPSHWETCWDGAPLELPTGLGYLELMSIRNSTPATPSSLSVLSMEESLEVRRTTSEVSSRQELTTELLIVRFRRGGEHLHLPNDKHSRELRDLFQQTGIPPWERSRLPLIFNSNGILLAVGDIWISEAGQATFAQRQCRLLWKSKPPSSAF